MNLYKLCLVGGVVEECRYIDNIPDYNYNVFKNLLQTQGIVYLSPCGGADDGNFFIDLDFNHKSDEVVSIFKRLFEK
jgi:hypothetical protein